MKIVKDFIEFRQRTQPLSDDFDLDLMPDQGLGRFLPSRLDEMIQYCANHPSLHIISILPGSVQINKPVPAARFYMLADGDPDPNIWFCNSACQELINSLEIFKFDRS